MITITQLLFVVPGQEQAFLDFESIALSAMERYGGRLLYRIRPPRDALIAGDGEAPFEIHVVTFPTRGDLDAFFEDEERKKVLHLKEQSLRSALVVQQEL